MPSRFPSRRIRTITVLSVTQLAGWGMSFDMLGVMGRVIAPDLGLANEIVFSGLTVMMVASAFGGPAVGRLLARHGASRVLAVSSLAFAAGLLMLSFAQGIVLYMTAWTMLGGAGALGLTAPAYAAIVERDGADAKRTIATLMLFTGLSTTIFWPLLSILQASAGWRSSLTICAALHLLVCFPLHLFALPKPLAASPGSSKTADVAPVAFSLDGKRQAFWLIAAATTISTFVTFGLAPSLIELLKQSGASPALALQLGSARGALGISARFLDMLLGRRGNPLLSALMGLAMIVASFLLLPFAGGSPPLLIAFVALYGFGSGIMAVARALLPLAVFSRAEYGLQSARLSLPQNLANALAPVVFTALLDRGGANAAVACGAIFAAISFGLIVSLVLRVREARAAVAV